jgi:class 3 adenylate cyclase/tetratricopeptide (TPR) repeat protein
VKCNTCDYANDVHGRYCGGCGRPLTGAASPRTGERRQLTVLMCDIVDSTPLSQHLDPEDLRDVITEYQRVCSDVVERHDGHIALYVGDGIVIYFGYPHAHEDDARRAVRCSLDIIREMQALSVRLIPRSGVPVRVRIGIHTGRVVVASVATGAGPQDVAQGETLNVAARVQSTTSPDSVSVTEATWRIISPYFTGEWQGRRELRGIAQPISVWRVTGTGRIQPSDSLTAYVGRAHEMEALRRRWIEVEAGSPHFVTVQGDPGIGKSRLLQEFTRSVAPAADHLETRCTPDTQNSAFLPVIELIEKRLGLDRTLSTDARLDRIDERLRELEITAGDAGPLFAALLSIPTGSRYPPLVASPIRRRLRTLEVLVDAVHKLAARQPTILFVEDLHWADASTVELLHRIVSSSKKFPLFGLFTSRPEFRPPWAREANASMIDLVRLDNAEAAAVARGVARGKTLPGEVLREVTARCEGVPLYIEEVVRALIDSSVLVEREFSWHSRGPVQAGLIPASIDASLMARLDRIGSARATAQLAATIGREFTYPLLRAVSDRSDEDLGSDLQQMVDAALASPTGVAEPETYAFRHALIQMAAYESLLRSQRQQYHERIANVLRDKFTDDAQHHPEMVALHLSGAGHHLEASDYWLAAGQNALARMAIPEAHGHFSRALDGLKTLGASPVIQEKELDLQIAIAPTLMTLHGWASPRVAEACERARDLCQQLNRPDKLYPALWGLWTNLFVGGLLDRALATAVDVLTMAQASGSPLLEVTGRHAVAYTHYYRGEWADAMRHAEAGLALFSLEQERAITSTFQLSSSVNLIAALGSSLWMAGHQDSATVERERMVNIARQVNHPSALSNALGVACYMLVFQRDFVQMRRYADEVKSFARDEGWELWYAVGVMSSGWSRCHLGDHAGGLKELFEGVALFRATQSDLMGPTVAVIHGEGLHAAGRTEEAIEMLNATAATARRGSVGVLLPEVYRLLGELYSVQGDMPAAERSFEMALQSADDQHALSLAMRAALSYEPLLTESGRRTQALQKIRGYYKNFIDSFSQPDLTRARQVLNGVPKLEGAGA